VNPEWTGQARLWIVGGYTVVFVASIVEFIGEFSSFVHAGPTTTIAVDVTLGPVVAAGSLWTWWWLSKLNASDDGQRRIFRSGVAGLIVVLVAEGTMSFTSFTTLVSIHSAPKWVLAEFLLSTLGEVASAIGFLASYIALRSPPASQTTTITSSTLED